MRWLQSRGAATCSLSVCSHSAPGNHKALQSLQAASMVLLPQLPNLQDLCIYDSRGFMVPERHLHVVECLQQLKSLSLFVVSDDTWDQATLEPFTNLSSLTSLCLVIQKLKGPLWTSPLLTHLTRLRELRLQCWGAGHGKTSPDHLMETVSKLTTLETLVLIGILDYMPAQLGALSQLTQIDIGNVGFGRPVFAIPPDFSLCINLQRLHLSECPDASDKSWKQACTLLHLLACMTDLAIRALDLSKVRTSSWLLPSELTSLELEGCGISTMPATICNLAKLRHLTMSDPGREDQLKLTALPTGPYLYNLESLDINGLKLGAGPEALAHAVKLRDWGRRQRGCKCIVDPQYSEKSGA